MKQTAATSRISHVLTTDFCPWANKYVYWLKRPLGVLVVAAGASLACGFFVAPQGLVLAAAIAAVIALGVLWPWLGLRGLSGQLEFPQRRGIEGEPIPVSVVLRNRWPFPVWGLAIENGFFTASETEPPTVVALSGIRGWSRSEFRWQYHPRCRGIYPTESPDLVTEFPFGIWKAHRSIATRTQLIVWPRIVPLEAAQPPGGGDRWYARPCDDRDGNEGERAGVRDFRGGDSLRLVHWSQTAKSGRLIVCQRQASERLSVVIAIDTDPTIHHDAGCDSTFEWSVRVAASICELFLRQSARVFLIANHECWEVAASAAGRRAAGDWLARIGPQTRPELDRVSVNGHMQRFLITTSARRPGPPSSWNTVVMTDDQARQPVAFAPWILIQQGGDVQQQFARQWNDRVRRAWRAGGRRRGIA